LWRLRTSFVFRSLNEWAVSIGKRKVRVDRGCIFTCAGGDVDTGLCERCYEKIGIDTDWWDLIGLAERPVSFEHLFFFEKKIYTHSAAPYITILSYSVIFCITLQQSTQNWKIEGEIDNLKIFFFQLSSQCTFYNVKTYNCI